MERCWNLPIICCGKAIAGIVACKPTVGIDSTVLVDDIKVWEIEEDDSSTAASTPEPTAD